MDTLKICLCCLLPADKDLKTPYSRHGQQVYADMLEECFQIHLTLGGECGTCEVCVGRLRDASDFKLQVQRSQVELQRLQGALDVKGVLSSRESTNAESECEDNNLPFKCQDRQKPIDVEDGVIKGNIAIETINVFSGDSSDAESAISESGDNNSPFKCQECQKTFDLEDSLISHMAAHIKDSNASKTHVCKICCKFFELTADFTKHMEIHDGLPCGLCTKVLANRHSLRDHIKRHMKCHKGDIFPCQRCPNKFKALAQLKEHEVVHTEKRTDSCENTCNICCQSFDKKNDLTNHMEIHNQLVTEGSLRDNISTTKESSVKEKRFSCEVCNRKFRHNHHLKQHMTSHQREDRRQIFSKKFAEQSHLKEQVLEYVEDGVINGNLATETINVFSGDSSNAESAISQSEDNNSPFKCQECQKTFDLEDSLISHMAAHIKHSNASKTHVCKICCKFFELNADFTKHMEIHNDFESQRVHMRTRTGEKPYSCEVCDKKFGHKHHIKRHMKSHKGDIFPCQKYSKKFAEQSQLKEHELVHTEIITDSCENTCNICRQRFEQKIYLTNHMEIHKEHIGTKDRQCGLCKKIFASKVSLNVHMSTHTGLKPYSCQVCSMQFRLKHHLKRHHMKSHKGEYLFFCRKCPKQFLEQIELKKHGLVHAEKNTQTYTCEISQRCPNKFKALAQLKEHEVVHTEKRNDSCENTCNICCQSFDKKNDLTNHMEIHNQLVTEGSLRDNISTTKESSVKERRFSCEICNRKFRHYHHLKQHMTSHQREDRRPILSKRFAEKSHLKEHVLENVEDGVINGNLATETINVFSGDSSNAESAISQSEDNNSPFKCQECQKTFDLEDSLISHMAAHIKDSNASETHVCKICCKFFELNADFTKHMEIHNDFESQRVHMRTRTGEKPYSCEVCDKKFGHKHHIKRHMKSHKGDIFPCQKYSKKFAEQSQLKEHELVHTEIITDSCENTCNICRQRFEQKIDLTNHMEIHKEHIGTKDRQCGLCKKIFASKVSLNVHMSTHTGLKPYSCQVCSMQFRLKHHLKRHHMKSHKGEYLFFCRKCPKQFLEQIELKKHGLVHAEKNTQTYTCEISQRCPNKFKALAQLKEHEVVHTEKRNDSCENTCNICFQSFDKKNDLTNHMEIHNQLVTEGSLRDNISTTKESSVKEKRFSCEICNRKFRHYHHLKQHMTSHQREDRRQIFSKKFAEQSHLKEQVLENVEDGVINGNLATETINVFSGDSSNAESAISQSEDNNSPFKCQECQKTFDLEDSLISHMAAHIKDSNASKTHVCKICCKFFELNADFTKHMEIHDGFPCGLCTKVLANQDSLRVHIKRHMKCHKGDIFPCQRCPNKFKALAQLKEHEVVHTEKRNDSCESTCNICCQSFEQKTDLTNHMEIHNQLVTEGGLREQISTTKESSVKEKLFSCEVCNRKFRHNHHLKQHMTSHQREDRRPILSKRFAEQSHLKEHVLENVEDGVINGNLAIETINVFSGDSSDAESAISESGDNNSPFKCQECQKTFDLEDSLISHMAAHTNGSITKSHVCKCCDFFELAADFTKHMEIHDGLPCGLCTKVLANRDSLRVHIKRHMKCHKGDIFPCQRCPNKFKALAQLKEHEVVHTEIITDSCENTCNICRQRFEQKIDLTNHMEIHKEHIRTKDRQCGLCKKIYASKVSLTAHMSTHTGLKPYSCQVCSMQFRQKHHLKRHHMRSHKGEFLFFCRKCPKQFIEQIELKKHGLVHAEKNTQTYTCETSKKRFGSNIHLQTHLLEHKKEEAHTCQICKKKFKNKSLLNTHVKTHIKKSHTCEKCEAKFKDIRQLRTHITTTHIDKSHTCEICKTEFKDKSRLRSHLSTHIDNMQLFTCDVCKKQFALKHQLANHMRLHLRKKRYSSNSKLNTGGTSYWCDDCGKRFTSKSYLKIHMRTHTSEKLYSCFVCQKQFNFKSSLDNHLLLHADTIGLPVGIRDKCFCCETCGKLFVYKHKFISHVNEHMGVTPYICDTCNKRFTNKQALRWHKLTHTRVKSYTCDTCHRRFYEKATLKAHMIVHTGLKPFSCEICKRQFSFKSALRVHMKYHAGEKPYVCNVCQTSFVLLSSLRLHKLTHTAEKPFPCHVCGKAFITKYLLNKHLLIHNRNC